jgi:hypothetical protein
VSAFAQQPNPAPNPQAEGAQKRPDEHHAAVNERGAQAMGFSYLNTTHHFRLSADGGAIEMVANDAQDATSLWRDEFVVLANALGGRIWVGTARLLSPRTTLIYA